MATNPALWTSTAQTEMYRFFAVAFNAAPGTTYMDQLYDAVTSGMSTEQIVEVFTSKSQFTNVYPRFMSNKDFATKLVNNVVGSSATDAAKATAVADIEAALASGYSRGKVVYQIFTNLANKTADDATWAGTAKQMANQVAVSKYYTETLLQGGENLATLQKVIAGVTKDTSVATTAALQSIIDTAVPTPGQTFTLTTGVDTGAEFTGKTGNDTFTGVDNNTADIGTLTSGDSLVGGAGTDTLRVIASGTASAPSIATDGIEVLSVTNNSGAGVTYDASLMAGLAKVSVTAGLQATTVSNAKAILATEMLSTSKDVTVGSAAAAVVGLADSADLTLNAVGTVANTSFTYNGIETINVTLSGAASGSATQASRVTIASDELETVKVSGSVNGRLTVNLTGADAATQTSTFDASGTTAGVNASITLGDSVKAAITGGTGNDSFTITTSAASASVTKDMTIAGGDGVDTLVMNGAYSSTATSQAGANVTGFEVASGTVDQRAFPANTFTEGSGSGSYDKMGATFSKVTATGTATIGVTRAAEATTDALTVALARSTAGTATVTLTADDEETLTFTAGGATGSTYTVALESESVKNIVVSGANALSLGTVGATSTALASVDASAHTGATFTVDASASNAAMTIKGSAGVPQVTGTTVNTLSGGSKADMISGGAYNDSLTGNLGNDTLDGLDGNDTLVGGGGGDSIMGGAGNDSISAGTGDDYINGGTGNDSIDAGTGSDTVVGDTGNDWIKATISDSTNIDGGTGTDRLANVTSTISSTTASSVTGAFISVTDDVAPTLTSVDQLYVLIDGDAGTSTDPVEFDFTNAAGTTTLLMGTDSGGTGYIKLTNFAGSAITAYGTNYAAAEVENITIDGVGQSALTLTLENFEGVSSDALTVTGVGGLTIAGRSKSALTGNADQDNTLGTITADTVSSIKLSTSGSAAANAGALTVGNVSADQASTVELVVGGLDELEMGTLDTAGGDSAETVTITLGDASILDVNALNFDASAIDTVTITLGDSSIMTNSGAASGDAIYVDVDFASAADVIVTLGAGSTAALDLTGEAVTAGVFSLGTSSTLALGGGISSSIGSGTSSFTFSGRGNLANASGTDSYLLAGTKVTFDVSGLTVDTGAKTILSTATSSVITGNIDNDTIYGATGNDTLSGGNGADHLYGDVTGTAEVQTVTFGTSAAISAEVFTVLGTSVTFATTTTEATSATNFADAINALAALEGRVSASADTTTAVVTLTYNKVEGNAALAADVTAGNNTDSNSVIATYSFAEGTAGSLALSSAAGGSDSLVGGNGADTLWGGLGNDVLSGGDGADSLLGGAGADTMTGGNDADVFYFAINDSSATAVDVITSFSISADVLKFATASTDVATDVTSATDVSVTSVVAATDTTTPIGTADVITATMTSGIITLAGADKAKVDTLAEWLAIANLMVVTSNGSGGNDDDVVAFEFGGNTYLAEYDFATTGDVATLENLVQLAGVTSITAIGTAAAATTVVIGTP